MGGAADRVRGFGHRGVRGGGVVPGVGEEARVCAVRRVPNRRGRAGAGVGYGAVALRLWKHEHIKFLLLAGGSLLYSVCLEVPPGGVAIAPSSRRRTPPSPQSCVDFSFALLLPLDSN